MLNFIIFFVPRSSQRPSICSSVKFNIRYSNYRVLICKYFGIFFFQLKNFLLEATRWLSPSVVSPLVGCRHWEWPRPLAPLTDHSCTRLLEEFPVLFQMKTFTCKNSPPQQTYFSFTTVFKSTGHLLCIPGYSHSLQINYGDPVQYSGCHLSLNHKINTPSGTDMTRNMHGGGGDGSVFTLCGKTFKLDVLAINWTHEHRAGRVSRVSSPCFLAFSPL